MTALYAPANDDRPIIRWADDAHRVAVGVLLGLGALGCVLAILLVTITFGAARSLVRRLVG